MNYLVTGNEYVSLPTIRQEDAALEGISFLHMGAKGMIELLGSEDSPFLRPVVLCGGRQVPLTQLRWHRDGDWIPCFTAQAAGAELKGILLAPPGERGFGWQLSLTGGEVNEVWQIGLEGCWARTMHAINESKPVLVEKNLYRSGWNHSFCMDLRPALSLFAFAPLTAEGAEQARCREEFHKDGEAITYSLLANAQDGPACFFFGLGYEEVSAATSAKELYRQGFDHLLEETRRWLSARRRHTADPALDELLNRNLLFSYFFGSGRALDTEQYALVTSRSPRYYVSAAYWDRDSLIWSFPAILLVDERAAEEMLRYVFTVQIRNVGLHSRYIDGTLLEPGFELDELCAPILALDRFVEQTGRRDFAHLDFVEQGVRHILARLATKRHRSQALYETFLQPTDDMRTYPYITYDNVLVWAMLRKIAALYRDRWPQEECSALEQEAEAVRRAIWENCVFQKDGEEMFAWSVDLQGGWDIYDEPPGSLLLLPHYGFCGMDDPVWQHTAAVIRRRDYPYSFADCPIAEIGCPHAPHPWVLSIANSMLSGRREQAKAHLLLCKMDNGIACESVDEYTGESRTGDAFATCAGFLAYALYEAFGT